MRIGQKRVALRILAGTAACVCVVATAHADSRALKLGQIGVINQTLQPKPVRSSPGYNNANNPNNATSTYDANTVNSGNGANTANPAANANAAYGRGGTTGTTGNNR